MTRDAPRAGEAPGELDSDLGREPDGDDDYRARSRQRVSQRRRPKERAIPVGELPLVREMVGKQVRLRLPDGTARTCKVKVPVAPGDRVVLEDDLVVAFAPRETELRRGGNSGVRVVCANAEVLVIVTAALEPPFRPGLVDRMLVAASAGRMDAVLVLNKCDLGMPEEVLEKLAWYEALGYPIFLLSASQEKGIDPLAELLAGRVSVLAGHSGVGKSTLLNALIPGAARAAGSLDEWGRGRHTTTGAATYDLPGGGAIMDLPGIREYGIEFVLREELRHHFPELDHAPCRYADCLHDGEDGCVAEEIAQADRLESYRKLLGELS